MCNAQGVPVGAVGFAAGRVNGVGHLRLVAPLRLLVDVGAEALLQLARRRRRAAGEERAAQVVGGDDHLREAGQHLRYRVVVGGQRSLGGGEVRRGAGEVPDQRAEGFDLSQPVEAGALRFDLRAALAEVLQRAGRRESLRGLEEVLGRVQLPPQVVGGLVVQ